MNAFRRFGLVVVVVAVSAIRAPAAAIPQSPILFNKQETVLRSHLDHPVSPKSFTYPESIALHVEREIKVRQGGLREEYHDKATIAPTVPPPIPTLKLEVGEQLKEYNFYNLHFHRTAEHLETQNLNGLYSMELHLVHIRPISADGPCSGAVDIAAGRCELAAVGRWIEVPPPLYYLDPELGQDLNHGHNENLEKLFKAFNDFPAFDPVDPDDPDKKKKDKHTEEVANFNLKALLPDRGHYEYYRYKGSLTTPDKEKAAEGQGAKLLVWDDIPGPLEEKPNELWVSTLPVEWVMFQEPLTISQNQLDQYSAFINDKDNHFGAQYTHPDFNHKFAVWDRTDGHGLIFVAVPEPSTVWLLAVAGMVAMLRMRCRKV